MFDRKIGIAFFAILVIFLLLASPAFSAGRLFLVGLGYGGEADEFNVSFEISKFSTDMPRDYIVGIGFNIIFSSDAPSDLLEYPIPHSDYTYLGKRNKGNEYGFYGKLGTEIVKHKRIFGFILAGFSFVEEIDLVQSNVTGWYYEQASNMPFYGTLGGGIDYFLSDAAVLQMSYSARQGYNLGIGWLF